MKLVGHREPNGKTFGKFVMGVEKLLEATDGATYKD